MRAQRKNPQSVCRRFSFHNCFSRQDKRANPGDACLHFFVVKVWPLIAVDRMSVRVAGSQMSDEDLVELKFRLFDGSDIGPMRCSATSTVASIKARIFADWPKDKKIIPKVVSDIKLISAGNILENSKTIAQYRSPFGEHPGGVITMHVVVQPSLAKSKTEKSVDEMPNKPSCSCSIL